MVYTPVFPGAVPSFPGINPRTDGTDIVSATDVNSLYSETIQVAATLGANPQKRAAAWGVGTFDTSTDKTTVKDRVTNNENGTYIAYTDYLSRTAGTNSYSSGSNTIQPASGATSTVNLIVKPQTGQTADLFQAVVGSTVVTQILADGTFKTSTIDGGSA